MSRARTERDLVRRFTGMVAASLVVHPDVDRGTVDCGRCADRGTPTTLAGGDRVRATVWCYDNHSWEILGVHCDRHDVASVAGTMGVAADDQAVVRAVLEPTGYHSPDGRFYPEALSLGEVEILDYSPAADGY